ncbi:hypothetical protein PSHT_13315 [Puccinia striiformis]|uniref:DUF7143 domain-containing protein n=1 Tax=Puccinia striiformis TaxID=27350 RepID=A0A2S4URV1_9BASI|nr:hypothetical protein PSHT_13315 [Puccinia striiformis]
MTGQFKVPDEVHINPRVTCLEGYQAFHNIPDVVFNTTDLSINDYQRKPEFSPVGFALEFFTPKKRNAKITKVLLNLMTVYDATNAALRSYGNERIDDGKKIKGLSGPASYLTFQHYD